MSVIKLNVTEHLLTLGSNTLITESSINVDGVKVEFDSSWNGFAPIVVFSRKNEISYAVLDETGFGKIPNEILAINSNINICVLGIGDSGQITTNIIKFKIKESMKLELDEPDADVYRQILSQYGRILESQKEIREEIKEKSAILQYNIDAEKTERIQGDNELNEKMDNLTSRMNSFVTLKEGSTTGDAELMDIRVGVDGTIYDNAGEAVRGQVSQLSSENTELKEDLVDINVNIKYQNAENLFDCDVASKNIGQYGYNGAFSDIADWRYYKTKVKPNTKYTINKFSHIVFWENNTYLSGTYNASTSESKTVSTPEKCNYVTISVQMNEIYTTIFNQGEKTILNPTEENSINIKNNYYEIAPRLPYIYQGKVICGKVNDGTTAYYSGVDCGGIPSIINTEFIFEVGSKSGTVAIISNPNGLNRISHIVQSSLHLTITSTAIQLDCLGEKFGKYYYHNLISKQLVNSIPLDGKTKTMVTLKIDGIKVSVTVAFNSSTETYEAEWSGDGNHTLSDFVGQYVTFEHYCGGDRTEFAMPMFTYFEVKGISFERIFDYFERENSVLTATPTGKNYVLLTNEDKYSGNWNN